MAAEAARRSELFEEAKAATASFIVGTVVIVRYEIESPFFSDPLPPGDGDLWLGKRVRTVAGPTI